MLGAILEEDLAYKLGMTRGDDNELERNRELLYQFLQLLLTHEFRVAMFSLKEQEIAFVFV